MTSTEYRRRRAFGQIPNGVTVTVLLWKFRSVQHVWEEYFVDGRYESRHERIEDFKRALAPLCEFLGEYQQGIEVIQ